MWHVGVERGAGENIYNRKKHNKTRQQIWQTKRIVLKRCLVENNCFTFLQTHFFSFRVLASQPPHPPLLLGHVCAGLLLVQPHSPYTPRLTHTTVLSHSISLTPFTGAARAQPASQASPEHRKRAASITTASTPPHNPHPPTTPTDVGGQRLRRRQRK